MSVPVQPTKIAQVREAMLHLLLTIDEAWVGHSDRLMGRACVSCTEVGFEDFLFQASDWIEDLNRLLP